MNIRLLALLIATMTAPSVFAQKLPDTEMDNLAGQAMHIPADLQGDPVFVILAFAHDQRDEAGRVLLLLQQAHETNDALGWYELPIIDAPSVAHFFIKNGMRSGTDQTLHPHIIPQFVDADEWRKASGISAQEPLLAKVDHEGNILKTAPLSTIRTLADVGGF